MTGIVALPTVFESLAAICKFIAVPKMSPAFHAKQRHPVEFASAFLRVVASNYPLLEQAFRKALPLPLAEGAVPIQQALAELTLPDEKVRWFNTQMTEVLRVLLPAVRDPELPSWLSECKWAIEGAFQ